MESLSDALKQWDGAGGALLFLAYGGLGKAVVGGLAATSCVDAHDKDLTVTSDFYIGSDDNVQLAPERGLAYSPPVRVSVSSLQRLCSQTSDTMTDAAEGAVASAVNSVVENLSKLPAAHQSNAAGKPTSKSRMFNREKSVHQLLGGGKAADVLLWKHKPLSAGVLAGTTLAWILFEWSGYTLLSLLSNVLLFLIVVFFLWSNAAGLLNRSPPPLPELKLSEDTVVHTAKTLRVEINKILSIAHDVALGKDFKLFLKVVAGLWVLSTIGAWCNFLTLIYLGVIASHTLPVLYEKYEDEVDKYGKVALDTAHVQYKKIDNLLLSKIPRATPKDKKAQ
ncbi:hypothetical protein R1sor_004900 [Riccia sorocarpa]|uniref:Reticulon-like protein n=1 Tax=Riccia sorocarpa TaxID=122646 RepID=A0ABD3HPG7_9MARC